MTTRKATISTFDEFRNQMPVTHSLAYFDHAAVGPLSEPAYRAIQEWCSEATLLGDKVWPKWNRRAIQLRKTTAAILNAKESEIALVPNTSAGINLVADGLDWQPGDNVVLPGGEFPSNLFPWMLLEQRGVEVRIVPLEADDTLDLARLEDACDAKTKLISVSWVGFASGYRLDVMRVSEIAKRYDAFFFLDAIQGVGVFPLDVHASGVDFLAADGHKWMLGPEGAGVFFVSEHCLDRLRPQQVGWRSVVSAFNYSEPQLELRNDAARFEGGSQNLVGITGLSASLQMLSDLGLSPTSESLANQVILVSNYLCERLASIGSVVHSPRAAEIASGIVSFEPPRGTPEQVRHTLMDRGIVLSCRGGRLRAAVHAYNNAEDVDRLVDELDCIR